MPRSPEEKASRIRIEAAALRAESRQARRQAQSVRCEHNVLLQAAARIVADFLHAGGFALAEPVRAELRTTPEGSTGVDVTVRLQDPADTAAVQAAIDEQFGDETGVDVLRVT